MGDEVVWRGTQARGCLLSSVVTFFLVAHLLAIIALKLF